MGIAFLLVCCCIIAFADFIVFCIKKRDNGIDHSNTYLDHDLTTVYALYDRNQISKQKKRRTPVMPLLIIHPEDGYPNKRE